MPERHRGEVSTMLTAYQCEVVAFVTDGGIICRDCAIERLDRGELGETTPVIRYSLDEEQSAQAEDWLNWDYEAEEIRETEDGRFALIHGRWHAEGCACAPAVYCDDDDSHELVEEYVDYTCRGVDEPVQNVPAPRWVPCSWCHAGDGERHREGCRFLQPSDNEDKVQRRIEQHEQWLGTEGADHLFENGRGE